MFRRFLMGLLTILMMSSFLTVQPASAAPRERCFSETGHCVSGAILAYWEKNGGLRVFGYPISDLRNETNRDGWTGPTQWFERDRLEDHANEGYAVLAGRLGAQYLEYEGVPWQSYGRVSGPPSADCRYFALTGHSLCGIFKTYWEKNGGLERFGYPITEAFQENLADFSGTVQYFERRRMEYHPELAGTSYEVLLGLLGNAMMDPWGCKTIVSDLQKTAQAYPETFGCGALFPRVNVRMAVQPFERGAMLWMEGFADRMPNIIWVVFYDNQRGSLVWRNYIDDWREGMPVSGGEKPPTGLYEPIRGFGKIWREDASLRNTLGWAAAPETADSGHFQYFQSGANMLYRASVDRVYLLYGDGRADDVARIR